MLGLLHVEAMPIPAAATADPIDIAFRDGMLPMTPNAPVAIPAAHSFDIPEPTAAALLGRKPFACAP